MNTGTKVAAETPGAPWYTVPAGGHVLRIDGIERASIWPKGAGRFLVYLWNDRNNRLTEQDVDFTSLPDATAWAERQLGLVWSATTLRSAPAPEEGPPFNKVRAVFMQTVQDGPEHWTTSPVVVDLDQNAPLSDALDAILAAHGNVDRVTCHLIFERSKGDG